MASSSQVSTDPSTSDEVKRTYRFAIIPEWVLYHPDLSPTDVRVYGALDRHAGRGGCFPGLKKVGEEIGVSIDTVRRAVVSLAKVGAVVVTPRFRDGRQTTNDYALAGDAPMQGRPSTDATLPPRVDARAEREPEERENPTPPGFDEFWDLYPRKVAKGDAMKAWKATKPADRVLALARLRLPRNGIQNVKGKDDFTPYPASWLRAERWLDELPGEAHAPTAPHWKDQLQAEEAARKANLERLAERKRAEDERLAQLEAEQDAR